MSFRDLWAVPQQFNRVSGDLCQILKSVDITNVSVRLHQKVGDRQSQVNLFTVHILDASFKAPGQTIGRNRLSFLLQEAKHLVDVGPNDSFRLVSGDFTGGFVKQGDKPVQVGGKQSPPHAIDNVFIERLQISQLASFVFQFSAGSFETLRQMAAKISHSIKRKDIGSNDQSNRLKVKLGGRG